MENSSMSLLRSGVMGNANVNSGNPTNGLNAGDKFWPLPVWQDSQHYKGKQLLEAAVLGKLGF